MNKYKITFIIFLVFMIVNQPVLASESIKIEKAGYYMTNYKNAASNYIDNYTDYAKELFENLKNDVVDKTYDIENK